MKQEGGENIDHQGHQGERQQGATLGAQDLVHVASLERQHAQNLTDVTHRQGDRNDPASILGQTHIGLGRAIESAVHLGGQFGIGLGEVAALARPIAGIVLDRRPGGMSRRQGLAGNGLGQDEGIGDRLNGQPRRAVGHGQTIDIEQTGALPLGDEVVGQPAGRLDGVEIGGRLAPRDADARLAQHPHQKLSLGGQGLLTRLDQTLTQFVQQQPSDEEDDEADQVQRQDQTAQPRAAEPFQASGLGLVGALGVVDVAQAISFRGSGIRRRKGFRWRRTRHRPRGTSCASA